MKVFDENYLEPEMMVNDEIKQARLIICHRCPLYEPPICKENRGFVSMMVAYNFNVCPKGNW